MPEQKLNAEEDFLVKESPTTNYIAGLALLSVFFVSMAVGDYGWSNYLMALTLFLIPGALYVARARRNTTIIRINKSGFYYGGKLITSWDAFYDARVSEEKKVGSIQDRFVLLIRYYGAGWTLIYTFKISLGNTQDKAEDEIIQAIDFFYKVSRGLVTTNSISDAKPTKEDRS